MRLSPRFYWLSAAILLLANVLLRFDGTAVWDDAHFFLRYAHNALQHGHWAWNADEPAAYGLTAPLYGGLLLLLRMLPGLPGPPSAARQWAERLDDAEQLPGRLEDRA